MDLPRPDPPRWAEPLMGRRLAAVFEQADEAACVGYVDGVEARYRAAPAGARLAGWGWDRIAQAPAARILIVDAQGRIVGAGEAGVPRPDVAAARPDITSGTTGWWAVIGETEGEVEAWGVLADSTKVCRLDGLAL